MGGQPEYPPLGLGTGEIPQLSVQVDGEVVPHQHDDSAVQLVMGGQQQVPVLGLGERPGLALAAAVAVQPVGQPTGAPPRTRMTGGDAAPPRASARRPHRLAALVFDDDPAAEGRRGALIRSQASSSTPPPRGRRARSPCARRSGRSNRGGAADTRSPGRCRPP